MEELVTRAACRQPKALFTEFNLSKIISRFTEAVGGESVSINWRCGPTTSGVADRIVRESGALKLSVCQPHRGWGAMEACAEQVE